MQINTALITCFLRYYHTMNSNIKIYNDKYAKELLTDEEITNISNSLKSGINYFNPNYNGDNPLIWIINNQLAPSVLARSKFNQIHLYNEIRLGLKQYLILASGYDTSGLMVNDKVKVYEIDKEEMIKDKIRRVSLSKLNNKNINYISTDFNSNWIKSLLNTDYNPNEKTFCSLLGISYYLDKEVFKETIMLLSDNMCKGSSILFDYPNDYETDKERINQELASSLNEEMKSIYSYSDIENIGEYSNMLIYEHRDYKYVNEHYFKDYNNLNPDNKIKAPKGISYVLLVKKN